MNAQTPRPPLDSFRTIETPEGVDIALPVAGPIVRALAWSIDQLVRMAVYVALAMASDSLGSSGEGLLYMAIFAVEWFYPVAFELMANGATPGKMALGIAVVHADGTPVAAPASVLRNLLRAADFLPAVYVVGFLCMVADRNFRRLGDMAAGTVVIHRRRRQPLPPLPSWPPVPPGVPLTVNEQRAIIAFAERSTGWTDARCQELADLAAPALDCEPKRRVERLQGMARWLLGRR